MQVTVLGHSVAIKCSERDCRRLEDLAASLNERLGRTIEGQNDTSKLVLLALSLLDEVQAKGAALALARHEIERLTDMVVEAKLEAVGVLPVKEGRGLVGALQDERCSKP